MNLFEQSTQVLEWARLLEVLAAHARSSIGAARCRTIALTADLAEAARTETAEAVTFVNELARAKTFADAIDSFPLCCPARATFLTGQYAHNHEVAGNFYPYGWYGMKRRGDTLPAWLRDAGYRTGMVGKWLNGYGALDAHGEIPKGFDIWRSLLDVSAYDYYNFLMNSDGKIKSYGDADFARKLVRFSKIQVIPPAGKTVGDILAALQEQFGPPPYSYWGEQDPKDYSTDVTGQITTKIVKQQAKRKGPFFVWWSPAAPHRGRLTGGPSLRPRSTRGYGSIHPTFSVTCKKPCGLQTHLYRPDTTANRVESLSGRYSPF